MEDQLIIKLFHERSEDAIRELDLKYGTMCKRLANRFLHNEQDAEECINDAYLAVWNTIPPQTPSPLSAYVCRIVKNVTLKKYRTNTAQKRNHNYDVLYALYPDIAVKLMSVNICCEDEGIRMEVEGVSIEDNRAYVYISMQDLEGNRIDESMDLFDNYSVHTNADQVGGCTLVDFDEENGIATFLITIQHMNDTAIEGSAMTFSVSQFLSGKKEVQKELSQVDMDSISFVTEMQVAERLDIRGQSYTDGVVSGAKGYLLVDDNKSFQPTPGVTVTNYGWIEAKLHIQVYYEDILRFDNHGTVYLSDINGNTILPQYSIAFWDEERKGSYEEYIFDISENELDGYTVYGHFYTCENLVQGDWKVRFQLEPFCGKKHNYNK